MKKSPSLPILLLIAAPIAVFASGSGGDEGFDITDRMMRIVLQLGVIVMVARLIGLLFQNVKLPIPSVLVEVFAGVLIGPHLLGCLPLPGFPDGIFPLASATGVPVTPELYAIATIASIIMLFTAGLETDLALLLKFSVVGLIVGFSGDLLSFIVGVAAASAYFNLPVLDKSVLFIGVICMATSVGITARILSERRKMDSPEGVTILAAAVIDDVIGIIALTIVIGFIATTGIDTAGMAETGSARHVAWVIAKAVLVWLGFTAAGIIFAGPLSRIMKSFKSVTHISIAALGLAFILSGIFQMAGLAMVIGAYVVGLSLSKTDLTDTVRDSLEVLYNLFVPVFFIVMGMLVDLGAFMSKEVLIFGAVYTAAVILTKILGCGIPVMFMGFNRIGALRIGMGMVPRGEVALIIAGIGLSSGIIDQRFFGAGIMMVLGSIIVAPPFVSALFKSNAKGTKKEFDVRQATTTPIHFACGELTGLVELRVAQAFRAEGFFVHSIIIDAHNVYHLRKNDTMITMHCRDAGLEFESDAKDVMFIKTIVYEALLQINGLVTKVKDLIKPESLLKDLTGVTRRVESETKNVLAQGSIIPCLKAETKRGVIEELIDILVTGCFIKVKDRDEVISAVTEREKSMSTGMQYGVALPHARTDAVSKTTVAVGLSCRGVDYNSLDGEPSKIFVLILSPQSFECSHLQFLANVSALLNGAEMREKLIQCKTREEIYGFFRAGLGG